MADTVAIVTPYAVGSFLEDSLARFIQDCVEFAGELWTEPARHDQSAFYQTIVGDAWQEDIPFQWPSLRPRGRLSLNLTWPLNAVNTQRPGPDARDRVPAFEYDREFKGFMLAYLCCVGRRFFIMKKRRFALEPIDMKPGDSVCILRGSDVPLILKVQKLICKFKGQAYVDGLMDYQRGLKHDVEQHNISERDFKLS